MAWETRRNGRKYYYTAKRVNGKVVKQYHGRGERGLMIASTVQDIARQRQANRDAWKDYLAELWSLEQISKLARIAARTAIYATYILAGYNRSRCHHWTKTKDSRMDIPSFASLPDKAEPSKVAEAPLAKNELDSAQELPPAKRYWPQSIDETIRLIMSGRRDLLEVLRTQLADVPELWREVSDLTRVAIQGWASKIAQGSENIAFRESIVLAATTERAKLLDDSSTIMERAIVERWVITKLQLAYFDIVVSSQDAFGVSKADAAIERRHKSAEHQFREATRQLTKVRSLQGGNHP